MKKNKVVGTIFNILLIILCVIGIGLFVFKISFVQVVVNGSSMNPTIENGSKGYMVKVTNSTKINRFDVVAGTYGTDDESFIIKRVLGLPNETIRLEDNILYVNNEIVPQDFTFIPRQTNFTSTRWTLSEDEYLLVGDNRAATIAPVVESKSQLIAKNGFSYLTYDINSVSCSGTSDYEGCQIEDRKWYLFKDGK